MPAYAGERTKDIIISATDSGTLNAKRTVKKYNIVFKGNGSTSGSMKKMSNCKYGREYTLKANIFTRKGYTFIGWNTKSDGSGVTYDDKEAVKNLTTINGKTVTLYAKWKAKKYDIKYELNGGKNNSSNPSNYTIKSTTITLKKPSKEGYKFVGWYSDKKCTKSIKSVKKGTTGNKKLYAKWKAEKYTITYNLNKGKNNSKNPTSYKITTSTIKLQNPTRKGYIFEGWYSDSSYTNQVKIIKKGSIGNKILFAKWVKNNDNENEEPSEDSSSDTENNTETPENPPQTEENENLTKPEDNNSDMGSNNNSSGGVVLPFDKWD